MLLNEEAKYRILILVNKTLRCDPVLASRTAHRIVVKAMKEAATMLKTGMYTELIK